VRERVAASALVVCLLGAAAMPQPSWSDEPAAPGAAAEAGATPGARPDDLLARVDVEQKLGTPLPLDTHLRDELGNDLTLGSFFGPRPVVLALVYYECPMLCTLVLNGLLRATGARGRRAELRSRRDGGAGAREEGALRRGVRP
jgi:cytochrome oxidase Cu insertion factor (SCO1/SenC/PrrC family)